MDGLPPGPGLGALQTLHYLRDPLGFYRSTAARYGDTFSVNTPLGPLVVCGHPEGIQALFSASPEVFTRWSTDAVSPLLGEGSLLLTSGPAHQQARRLLTPPFHGARMRAYGELIREAALREAKRWPAGQPFLMQDAASAISIEVILRALFGEEEPERQGQLRQAVLGAMAALSPTLMLLRPLRQRFAGVGPYARFLRARAQLDALVLEQIARRRARPGGEDVLSLLLQARYEDGQPMPEAEVRDQLVTLVFAGYETSGIALAWAFHWLDENPEVRAELRRRLDALPDTAEALAAEPYLEAVCSETLRIRPVVPEVIRLLRQPLSVQGHLLPPGVAVAACMALVHTRPDLYPEPDRFRPERFLERRYGPFEYFPFGGGSRRCIGVAFALYEMKIVLGTLERHRDVRQVRRGARRPVLRSLTMGPQGGVEVLAFERGAARM
jgi:cytochrome P450